MLAELARGLVMPAADPGREFGLWRGSSLAAVVLFGAGAAGVGWGMMSGKPAGATVMTGGVILAIVAAVEVLSLRRGPVVVTRDGVFVPMARRKERYVEWCTVRSWDVEMLNVAGGRGFLRPRPWLEFTRADGAWTRFPIHKVKDQDGFLELVDELVEAYGYRGL